MQLAIQNFVNPQLLIYQQKNGVNRQVYGLSLQPALSCDKVCFSGQNVDFLKLPKKEIYKRVQESINNFNLLGYGTEGSVYAIDGTDYCIKFSRNSDSRKSLCKNLTFKVSEQDKVNHVVAKLGNSAVIMQKIKGIPVSEINELLLT